MKFRDLRYIRLSTENPDQDAAFATDILGLQMGEKTENAVYLRSDFRAYSLCYSGQAKADTIALTVALRQDLEELKDRLSEFSIESRFLEEAECEFRKIKTGLSCTAPNGLTVEFVWRPLASGWRYHGARDAGIQELQSVLIACQDLPANERFWTEILGGTVSDWAGDTAYIRFDDFHHRIALYPSSDDRILGIDFAVEGINNVMQNFHFFQNRQVPVVHGPGRQTASDKMFVTARGPRDILYSFSTGMACGEAVTERIARQFANEALSHCSWGSETTQPEFLGKS